MPAEPAPGGYLLEAVGLGKSYGSHRVLDEVTLRAKRGEFVAILGPSGCGKTTLLRLIAGLDRPSTGRILLAGTDVTAAPPAARRVGVVFQSYALFPNHSARQNVAFGMRQRAGRDARADELLALVGLDGLGDRYPAQLSGGQQQRVALARALACEPDLLLLDEPLSALDARVRVRLRGEICRLQERLGITTILITHDQEEALTMADRVVVMSAGRIRQDDLPETVYQRPVDRLVADFLGAASFSPGWTVAGGWAVKQALRLRVAHADCPRAELAIRPEHVAVVGAADDGDNLVDGEILTREFRGPALRLDIRLAGGDWPLLVDVPPDRVPAQGPLRLRLPPERLLVYPMDSDAASPG